MEDDLANLNLDDQEDDPVAGQEEEDEGEYEFRFCLIGVTISEIQEKLILFRYYNEIDLKSMLDSSHWFFNQHLIIFHKLKRGEDPLQVPLHYMNFRVQIHDLPLDQCWKFGWEGRGEGFRYHEINQVSEVGSQRRENEFVHNMLTKSNEVLEEIPIDLVDGKKTQQVQQLEETYHNNHSISTMDNELLATASKQAGRS
ncbi:hypothetical protein Goari_023883 [Gossypium aridum]|uniref:DUF4283 domain-containing protein n=1 Tax=Gossypium aridum TaxID=34290 RepID=A0A7J8X4F5_GOSAI|nr:hypothetical protein [Gossypium aridum]